MPADVDMKFADDPAREAENAVAAAERDAREAEAEAERLAAGLRDDVKEKASRAAQSAARDAGGSAADGVDAAADTARGKADRADAPLQAHAFEAASVFLENTAADLRKADVDQMLTETRRLARRHPLAFVVGAAAIGLAAARLARAGDPEELTEK